MRGLLGLLPTTLAAVVGLLAACFAETGGIECTQGSNGCGCNEGACDGSLECNSDSNCVDPNCSEGTLLCTCYGNGTCDAGLSCASNICQSSEGGTGVSSGEVSQESGGSTGGDTLGGTVAVDDSSGGTTTEEEPPATTSETPGPVDTGGGGGCGACGTEQACFPETGCGESPYVNCEASLCGGLDVCEFPGGTNSICAPPCVEVEDCPVLDGAVVVCIEKSGCLISCFDNGDCDALPGSPVCINNEHCAYPSM